MTIEQQNEMSRVFKEIREDNIKKILWIDEAIILGKDLKTLQAYFKLINYGDSVKAVIEICKECIFVGSVNEDYDAWTIKNICLFWNEFTHESIDIDYSYQYKFIT